MLDRVGGVWTPHTILAPQEDFISNGYSVSLSGDGTVLAIFGASLDTTRTAVYTYRRASVGAAWILDAQVLVPTGYSRAFREGSISVVALSGDGATLAVAGVPDVAGFLRGYTDGPG